MAHLQTFDYIILALYFGSMLVVGFLTMKKAGKNASEFFLSGQNMPWWLLGFSLVATTFASDTPNLVTGLVREKGVAGNWYWWAFLLTGMTTVFIYAKLWRRLNVMTDIEFYEVRYSGKPAAFLRGFRTIYLGLIVNTVVMANVILAIIKILGIMLGTDPLVSVIGASAITVLFSAVGGLTAVIWADFILFLISMAGAILAAVVILQLPQVGGIAGLLSHPEVVQKMSVLPDFSDRDALIALLVIPLAVQWWSTWYPGAEPGGGSFTAQRMLAAKNEKHAIGAVLFFNFCHYAVRPWPWILVALASIIVYPDLKSLAEAFPNLPEHMIRDDMAYPAMLNFLPAGLFGLMLASLFAAFMSTIATLLNLGSSYMVNDFHRRFINPNASEKQLVRIGRLWTVALMVLACILALNLKSAVENFEILLIIGAGTGLIFLVRWFWWRVSAYSEIAAMIIALITALYFKLIHVPLWTMLTPRELADGTLTLPESLQFTSGTQLVISVAITTVGWILVTLVTPPTSEPVLRRFLEQTRAGGPGWRHVVANAKAEGIEIAGSDETWSVPLGIFCSVIGCIAVYAALFALGALLYRQYVNASWLAAVAAIASIALFAAWKRVSR
ncbi:MAG: sodium:solute symporter family protein [Planctomycetia bacterium]|nr:sodium:solute symporter family protein [Planctomycetia bacterium]